MRTRNIVIMGMCALVLAGSASAVSIIDVQNPGPIPPSATTGTSNFFFDVSGLGAIQDVNVLLAVTHTYNADLRFDLTSPVGTTVNLIYRQGGQTDDFMGTLLDDEATTPISTGNSSLWGPFTGSYSPENPLSAFDGEMPNGTWTLTVTDLGDGDSGYLHKTVGGQQYGTQLIIDDTVPGQDVIPEPMTMIGLSWAGLAVGGYLRRRRRA